MANFCPPPASYKAEGMSPEDFEDKAVLTEIWAESTLNVADLIPHYNINDITVGHDYFDPIIVEEEKRLKEEEQQANEKNVQDNMRAIEKKAQDKMLKDGNYVGVTDVPKYISHILEKDKYYVCYGGDICTPGEFHLNLVNCWNHLEKLMKRMQEYYETLEKNATLPWQGHLKEGFFVAAKHHNEFHRAMILEKVDGGGYKVKLVDYGDVITVNLKDIRYLPLSHFNGLPFQAISCSVNIKIKDGKDLEWNDDEGQSLRDIIYNKTLAVHFTNKIKTKGIWIWKVYIHFYDIGIEEITSFHLERQIVLIEKGFDTYDKLNTQETDRDKKVYII